ncbi:fimbrial biogenesis chaperone [Hafnia paralvei]
MKVNYSLASLICLLGVSCVVNAAVLPDRTRLVLNETDKSVSVRLTNKSETLPYLAQSWIEDSEGKKTRDFISPLPPLLRLEPREQSQVRLMALPQLATLPKDRESLFYYNIREVPPRTEDKNVMQIAMQSRLKLFWRPKAIVLKEGMVMTWDKVDISLTANGINFKNNTPYYVTVGYIGLDGKTLIAGGSSVMIAPFGQESTVVKNLPSRFQIGYIGDYGGLTMYKISCNSVQSVCQNTGVLKE